MPKKKIKIKKKKPEIYTMTLAEKMYMIRMGVVAVVKGYKKARLYTGVAGIGKSRTVIDELTNNEIPYIHVIGGLKNARSLYQFLYDNNDPNFIIVFDDVNNILKNKESSEILRAAVTNEAKRKVTYSDNKITITDNKKYYPHMIFESKIIIITNIPKKKIDEGIISRTSPIEIIADKYEIAEYVKMNIEDAPPLKVPLEWKEEVYNYIVSDIGLEHVKQFDFRIFEDAILWRCASKNLENDWKKHVCALVL